MAELITRNPTWTRDELILTGKADFRNANGVYMKVMNFRRFDPAYLAQGKKGLERGGKLEADVWRDFSDKPDALADTAHAIRAAIERGLPTEIGIEPDDDTFEAEEGKVLARVHLTRERNRKLVEQKKLDSRKKTGKLACEVCSFEFEAAYGDRGAGFIEAHHVNRFTHSFPGRKPNWKTSRLSAQTVTE
jgi:5-methylcytosine-specific restriction protein A